MKKLTKIITIMSLLFSLLHATSTWAEDKVLNIYFAGTGNTVNGSFYLDDSGIFGAKFDQELISELYGNDNSNSDLTSESLHYKTFIDGIGSTVSSLLNQADPALDDPLNLNPLFQPRGWKQCLNEAKADFIQIAQHTDTDDEIILNLIGFSRGGVLTMMMARWVSDSSWQSKIQKINILAYDPVPGYPLGDPLFWLEANPSLPNNMLTLSDLVEQFVAIYARDERSFRFEPVIPMWNSNKTKALLLMLPGSHETLVGNTEQDGHAGAPFPWPDTVDPELIHVSHMSRLVAEHLMSGPNWGAVPFDEPLFSEGTIEAGFQSLIDSIYTEELYFFYKHMNFTSFTVLFQWIDENYLTLGRDHQLLSLFIEDGTYLPFFSRWSYISPYRHLFEIVWRPFPQLPWVFANPDQVYNLYNEVDLIDSAEDWGKIDSFRGDVAENDTEAPIPNLEVLPDIIDECTVTISNPPKATDNLDGTIIGKTIDALTYTEQGIYTVTWTYTDKSGNSSSQTQTVIIEDTIAPTINISASRDILWPPNQKMVEVIFTVEVNDNCSAAPAIVLTSVESNQPELGITKKEAYQGDISSAKSGSDIQGANIGSEDYSIYFKADRDGYGDDRLYTITYTTIDNADNSVSGSALVTVPHDLRNK
ncbi:hypothetical protein [Shewanella atlantica]|uniref:DUF5011 domain-containing protein n=1 Tax=Shewanella atlantica TaxID=271099 RepID=A0A3S0KBR6_9GAMM|nr:hypothetical protein [Shewanella atlantica]RTR27193.1 hypothetical protein EKG39_20590 [Shewanella atlantica]